MNNKSKCVLDGCKCPFKKKKIKSIGKKYLDRLGLRICTLNLTCNAFCHKKMSHIVILAQKKIVLDARR